MSNNTEDSDHKNAPFKGARRATRQRRTSAIASNRRLTVRSEQRETPDVRKIARAIIAIATAQANDDDRTQRDDRTNDVKRSADE